jgi:hypothetical protein
MGKQLANELNRHPQHVDDRNVQIRLDPLDKGMGGVAGNRDQIGFAVFELLASRIKR